MTRFPPPLKSVDPTDWIIFADMAEDFQLKPAPATCREIARVLGRLKKEAPNGTKVGLGEWAWTPQDGVFSALALADGVMLPRRSYRKFRPAAAPSWLRQPHEGNAQWVLPATAHYWFRHYLSPGRLRLFEPTDLPEADEINHRRLLWKYFRFILTHEKRLLEERLWE
jgi:hypothetical protein